MVVFFGYDPRVEMIYARLIQYFQDPVLYKTSKDYAESKQPLDVYAVRVESMLLKDRRFLIAMVPVDPAVPVGTGQRLSTLRWRVFQARSLIEEDPHLDPLPVMQYEVQRELLQDISLHREDMNDDLTTYRVHPPLPIKVHLLHKKKGPYEYSAEGSLLAAVETYQTLVCLDERDAQGLQQDFGTHEPQGVAVGRV